MVSPANVTLESGDRRKSSSGEEEMAQYRDTHAEEMRALLTGVDKFLLNKHGQMIIRDQHLDIFSRYAYAFSYSIFMIAWMLAHEGD